MSNYNPYTKRQTMIAPDYEVYRYRSTYMNEVELHHHDFYEVYLLLRGRVEYIVENQLYRVRPGDWMLCSPLELHQARIATDADAYERIVLWIARPYLEGLSTAHTSLTRCFDTTIPGHTNLLRLPGATGAPLRTTVDKLCALKASKDYGSDLLAQSALVELLVGLNRAAADRGDARPVGTSDQVVDAVLHYINEHYSEPLTLDQLSEKFFISKYHLLRKFDAQVGTTVHRYICKTAAERQAAACRRRAAERGLSILRLRRLREFLPCVPGRVQPDTETVYPECERKVMPLRYRQTAAGGQLFPKGKAFLGACREGS